jgi:hypothetical protein
MLVNSQLTDTCTYLFLLVLVAPFIPTVGKKNGSGKKPLPSRFAKATYLSSNSALYCAHQISSPSSYSSATLVVHVRASFTSVPHFEILKGLLKFQHFVTCNGCRLNYVNPPPPDCKFYHPARLQILSFRNLQRLSFKLREPTPARLQILSPRQIANFIISQPATAVV